jgi:D-glycero-alpha-D-manno-heptose 1-phosphate guanylyltransferase
VNGDSLAIAQLAPLRMHSQKPDLAGAMLGVRVADASRFGTLVIDQNGMLEAFREKQDGKGVVNAGVYLLKKGALARFPQKQKLSMEYDVIPALLGDGANIAVEVAEGAPFLDIGTPESVARADSFIAENRSALIFPFTAADAS